MAVGILRVGVFEGGAPVPAPAGCSDFDFFPAHKPRPIKPCSFNKRPHGVSPFLRHLLGKVAIVRVQSVASSREGVGVSQIGHPSIGPDFGNRLVKQEPKVPLRLGCIIVFSFCVIVVI